VSFSSVLMVITTAVGIIHSTGMPHALILRTSGVALYHPIQGSMKLLIFGHDRTSNPYCVARIYFPTVGRLAVMRNSHTWSSFISVTIPLAGKYLVDFLDISNAVVNTRLQVVVVNRQSVENDVVDDIAPFNRTYIRCPWQKCIPSAWNQGSSLFPVLFIIPIKTRVIIR
jgi:hypothetical protein